jgi:hypothetical protein
VSLHDTDRIQFDHDGDWQDSVQAIEFARESDDQSGSPWGLLSAVAAWVVVALCAATVIVACNPAPAAAAEVDCTRDTCT